MKRNMNPFTNKIDGFVNNTVQTIKVGSIGAIYADNRH